MPLSVAEIPCAKQDGWNNPSGCDFLVSGALRRTCAVEFRIASPYMTMYFATMSSVGVWGTNSCAKIWFESYWFSMTKSGDLMYLYLIKGGEQVSEWSCQPHKKDPARHDTA